jgi:hypothetical protein
MTRIALACFMSLLGLYATAAATVAATATTLTNRWTTDLEEEGLGLLVGSSFPFPKINEGRNPMARLHSPIAGGVISLHGGNKTELGMNAVKDDNTFFLKNSIMAMQKISTNIIYPTNKKKKDEIQTTIFTDISLESLSGV